MGHIIPLVEVNYLVRAHVFLLVVDQIHNENLYHHLVDQLDRAHLLPHVVAPFPSLDTRMQNILVIQVNHHHKTSEYHFYTCLFKKSTNMEFRDMI